MKENELYLQEQIITYIGNKRKLLAYIEAEIKGIQKETGKKKLICADLFSGSGIVARMLKQYSEHLIVNDLEEYSKIINQCYLSNMSDFDGTEYQKWLTYIQKALETPISGVITQNYAPKDEANITAEDRVFYTIRNAQYIDTVRTAINDIPENYRKYFLAPLLHEASVHANTSGVFKGFYKDKNIKVGKFGGTAENCLGRIKADIEIKKPVLSNFECAVTVYQRDTNQLAKELPQMDVVYLDPPYNQHSYGANYFMLNTILNNHIGHNISKVSGIPDDWNRSDYNVKSKVGDAFKQLIADLPAKYIITSYNSEGFLSKDSIMKILQEYGSVKTIAIEYNAFRGSRNLQNRDLYVDEYLFVLCKERK